MGDTSAQAFQPSGNVFTYNVITASVGTLTNAISGALGWSVNVISGNILFPTGSAGAGDMPASGFTNTDPLLSRLSGKPVRCAYILQTTDVGVNAI